MKLLFLLLLFVSNFTYACERYVIGFKGINDVFDNNAFLKYANTQKACALAYSWNQYNIAVKFIDSNKKEYQLYGFSKGAESVGRVLKSTKRKPYKIITIGAHHRANVSYYQYGIRTENYFDNSGRNNISSGVHIKNVDHEKMQTYVNMNYYHIK